MLLKNVNRTVFSFLISSLFLSQAFSAQVTQVKNNKVMIDLQQEEAEAGQEFYLLNSDSKKVGLVQISIVKNGKAIGVILKGKSAGDETLELKPGSTGSSEKISEDVNTEAEAANSNATSKTYRYNTKKFSVLLGSISNSMTAKEADGSGRIEDVQLKGTSLGLSAALDMPVASWFTLRGTAGYEPFKSTGTATILGCDNASSTDCTADMNYISFGAYARFELYRVKALMLWGGVGGTMKFPLSKSSTALKNEDIKLTATYALTAGADYFITNKMYLPFSIEMQTYMPSDTVKASSLAIRAGIGFAY